MCVCVQGSCCELPKNGEEWQQIRDGHLPPLDHCTASFNSLLLVYKPQTCVGLVIGCVCVQRMISGDPAKRPTAADVLSLCSFCPSTKSKVSHFNNTVRIYLYALIRCLILLCVCVCVVV